MPTQSFILTQVFDLESASHILHWEDRKRATVGLRASEARQEFGSVLHALDTCDREVHQTTLEVGDAKGYSTTGAFAHDVVVVVHVYMLLIRSWNERGRPWLTTMFCKARIEVLTD